MKRSTIFTLGIIATFLTTVVGADIALARGGGGSGAGQRMSQTGRTYQHQYEQQNRYQYRQNNGSGQIPAENRDMRSGQYQNRDHVQLRDPATHNRETFMPAATQ